MFYRKIGKRIIDILCSFILIICLFPLFLIIGILIKIDSKGPIFFKHKRLGKNCKPILVWKFRTMVDNAISLGPEFTTSGDSRITKLGHFLRRTSIDELPQIYNVFLGEMSLIGPRPDAYEKNPTNKQKERTKVLPGITGWAQVNGRSALTYDEKIKYDIEYVENYNFLMDIKIIINTIKIVLKQKGIN